jgi:hypothetical protein
VAHETVNNPTFSRHADFLRFGTHVCPACAWMLGEPKRCHRSVLAIDGRPLLWPVIGAAAIEEDRPQWLDALHLLASLPAETRATGVLTTDPKPRMWPDCRIATVGSFGLVVRATEYDVSGWVALSLPALLDAARIVRLALSLGFAKRRVLHGLYGDLARARASPRETRELEAELRRLRPAPEFIAALVIAQKEDS